MLLSIVICTYNRRHLLQHALDSIEIMERSDEVEFIVVDNNSSDDTQSLVGDYSNKIPSLRYVLEKEIGLSNARNRGYRESKSSYVAYIDDDAKFTPNWLTKALFVIDKFEPDAFGGPIFPYYEKDKPNWFKDEYEIRMHSSTTGWLSNTKSISGSNMIIKRRLLEELEGFSTRLGMTGKQLAHGEETDFFNRLRKSDGKLYYDLELIIQHHVPGYKMDIGYQFYYSMENAILNYDVHNKYTETPLESVSDELIENLFEIFNALKNYAEETKLFSYNENRFSEVFMERLNPKFHHVAYLQKHYQENKARQGASTLNRLKTLSWQKLMVKLKNL